MENNDEITQTVLKIMAFDLPVALFLHLQRKGARNC
jgi:hypothetical protein